MFPFVILLLQQVCSSPTDAVSSNQESITVDGFRLFHAPEPEHTAANTAGKATVEEPTLPMVVLEPDTAKEILASYVTTYAREEVKQEGLIVRRWHKAPLGLDFKRSLTPLTMH